MRLRRWLGRMILYPLGGLAVLMIVWLFVPPISTFMAWSAVTGQGMDRRWVPLSDISPHLVQAVINSEDARFCQHGGVDWEGITAVLDEDGGPSRGASTIPMQTVKNLFLWQEPLVYVRKGVEIPLALTLDAIWPKRRIIEVYLNIAEWGDGIFGAEAAAQHHFRKAASALSAREAALLAAALPNPVTRSPSRPTAGMARLARRLQARSAGNPDAASCTGDQT